MFDRFLVLKQCLARKLSATGCSTTLLPMRTLAHRRVLSPVAMFLLAASLPVTASAHVKWFSNFSFADRPRNLQEALTPTTWALMVLSAAVLGVLVVLDRRLAENRWVNWVNQLLERYQNQSLLVMRIGIAATLLLAWDADSMLMPELKVPAEWIGWVQFLVVLLLLFPAAVRIAGVGVGFLYLLGIAFFGPLHMLDYAFFAGTAWYFYSSSFRSERWRATGLPALYGTVGFSLCWVSLEKLIYPDWGLYVLQQDPELAMGFPLQFFLTSTAFIEFTLGYLLIICLLPRPFAIVITLIFFSTTLVFGRTETIGHTPLHVALVVFVLEGAGHLHHAPITFYRHLPKRIAFAVVGFVLFFALLFSAYEDFAWRKYGEYQQGNHPQSPTEHKH